MIDKEKFKRNLIYNIEKYCDVLKIDKPILSLDMSIDELIDEGNEIKKDFWNIVNNSDSKISKKDLIYNLKKEYSCILDIFKNEIYSLDYKYYEQAKKECSKNIGKCFIRESNDKATYSMIVAIDKKGLSLAGKVMFNEYQYTAISFEYPFNNKLNPPIEEVDFFYNTKSPMFIDKEITKEEFGSHLKKVISEWQLKLNESNNNEDIKYTPIRKYLI